MQDHRREMESALEDVKTREYALRSELDAISLQLTKHDKKSEGYVDIEAKRDALWKNLETLIASRYVWYLLYCFII